MTIPGDVPERPGNWTRALMVAWHQGTGGVAKKADAARAIRTDATHLLDGFRLDYVASNGPGMARPAVRRR